MHSWMRGADCTISSSTPFSALFVNVFLLRAKFNYSYQKKDPELRSSSRERFLLIISRLFTVIRLIFISNSIQLLPILVKCLQRLLREDILSLFIQYASLGSIQTSTFEMMLSFIDCHFQYTDWNRCEEQYMITALSRAYIFWQVYFCTLRLSLRK